MLPNTDLFLETIRDPDLRVNDRDLVRDPRNVSLAALAALLRHATVGYYVILEPGDATRYDLALVRDHRNGLVVTRLRGNEPVAHAFFYDGMSRFALAEAAQLLASEDSHTAVVLGWWVVGLCVAIGWSL